MKKLVKTLPVIAAVLGLIAIISLFLPAIVVGDNEFLGFTTVFGYTKKTALGNFKLLSFSFMNLFTYALVIAGIVLAVLAYLKKENKLFAWIAAACFLLAGILFFFVQSFASVADGWSIVFMGATLEKIGKLGYGVILAGVCCILASVAMIANKLLEK